MGEEDRGKKEVEWLQSRLEDRSNSNLYFFTK